MNKETAELQKRLENGMRARAATLEQNPELLQLHRAAMGKWGDTSITMLHTLEAMVCREASASRVDEIYAAAGIDLKVHNVGSLLRKIAACSSELDRLKGQHSAVETFRTEAARIAPTVTVPATTSRNAAKPKYSGPVYTCYDHTDVESWDPSENCPKCKQRTHPKNRAMPRAQPASADPSDPLIAQMKSITDPVTRTNFYRAHKAEIDEAFRIAKLENNNRLTKNPT